MKNGLEDQYVIKNNKRLRYGYTTGSCAAGAARGAVRMLLSGETLSEVELDTPKGITLTLQLHDITRGETYVSCAVQKDAGDDPDTTNGILVYVKAEKFSISAAEQAGQETENREIPASDHPGRRGRCGACHQAGTFPERGRGGDQSGSQSHDPAGAEEGGPGI